MLCRYMHAKDQESAKLGKEAEIDGTGILL